MALPHPLATSPHAADHLADDLTARLGDDLSPAELAAALDEHRRVTLPRLERLWRYYRNPMAPARDWRGYRLAQEAGLPPRISGAWGNREVVVENDIGWRVQAMVDLLLGKPVRVASTAPADDRRMLIDRVLDRVWERSGGIALLQDAALLGQVYGYVDLLLRVDDDALRALPRADAQRRALAAADALRIEVLEPRRAVPVLDPSDTRTPRAVALLAPATIDPRVARPPAMDVSELFVGRLRRTFAEGRLVGEHERAWGDDAPPIVHIQNISDPFAYAGLGEVEPLIPLQDELNTRLSDRAHRVTMQSFRMYLARGIDGFEKTPIAPGQVWVTDNPDAAITAFGGDAPTPGEEAHIRELREALDKASGVPPLAGGVVQGRIGNLSSAMALRVTLLGALAKTARKRVTYGAGIARLCRLVLDALDATDALPTDPAERGVRLAWPDPLPTDPRDAVQVAKGKLDLGVPDARVLEELGYAATDDGVA